jgi:hypothetical protein
MALRAVHATVYRVEALARLESPANPSQLDSLLLEAVALAPTNPGRHLSAPARLAEGLLEGLRRFGLVRREGGKLVTTEAGSAARRGETYPASAFERRVFHLIDNAPTAAAQFLQLPVNLTLPSTEAGDTFSLRPLREAATRPDEWKRSAGFPTDVRQVYDAGDNGDDLPVWLRVPVVRAESLTAALVKAEAASGQWLAFAVRPDVGFALAGSEPILRLGETVATAVFPEIAAQPDWIGTFRAVCAARGWAAEDVEACRVVVEGIRLRVTVPARLAGATRAVADDGWFLAGEGRSRAAASVEIVAE